MKLSEAILSSPFCPPQGCWGQWMFDKLWCMTTNWSLNTEVSVMDHTSKSVPLHYEDMHPCICIPMDSLPFYHHTHSHTHLYYKPWSISSVISVYACSIVSAISKCMVYWRLWVCMRQSLEAVLTQLSDYSGIVGHREIRPTGKTTGEKQRKYHSVVLMKQHREESWLSDLTLRGFKT